MCNFPLLPICPDLPYTNTLYIFKFLKLFKNIILLKNIVNLIFYKLNKKWLSFIHVVDFAKEEELLIL